VPSRTLAFTRLRVGMHITQLVYLNIELEVVVERLESHENN